jgi:hypothetical protein
MSGPPCLRSPSARCASPLRGSLRCRRRALRRLPPGKAGRAAKRHRPACGRPRLFAPARLRALDSARPAASLRARSRLLASRLRRAARDGSTRLDADPLCREASAAYGGRSGSGCAFAFARSPAGGKPPAKVVAAGAAIGSARSASPRLLADPSGDRRLPPPSAVPPGGGSSLRALGKTALRAFASPRPGSTTLAALAVSPGGSPSAAARLRACGLPSARARSLRPSRFAARCACLRARDTVPASRRAQRSAPHRWRGAAHWRRRWRAAPWWGIRQCRHARLPVCPCGAAQCVGFARLAGQPGMPAGRAAAYPRYARHSSPAPTGASRRLSCPVATRRPAGRCAAALHEAAPKGRHV